MHTHDSTNFHHSQADCDPLVSAAVVDPGQGGFVAGDGAGTPLGITTKSVATIVGRSPDSRYAIRRGERFSDQDALRRLLLSLGVGGRICHCMSQMRGGLVEVVQSPTGVASYRGLMACGSVWACPVCSARISNVRRGELNELLAWGRGQGYVPVLLTLTMRHSRADVLLNTLEALKQAKKSFHQCRVWKAINVDVAGHVTATEVTYGANGWHPHFHTLLLVEVEDEAAAVALVEQGRGSWAAALARVGFKSTDYAYMVQGAARAGDYVAKWGAAEELALSRTKESRAGVVGRSPWQLLRDYAEGDRRAGALFVEYANTFRGRRQLVWSPGLKDLVGLGEVEDQELAEVAGVEEGPVEDLVVAATMERPVWRFILRHGLRARVLEIVEDDGAGVLWHILDLSAKYGWQPHLWRRGWARGSP